MSKFEMRAGAPSCSACLGACWLLLNIHLSHGALTATVGLKAGDVASLYHAFPVASCADLHNFFRSIPNDGDQTIYLGEDKCPSPSDAPNCYLAPSADGGYTRRLLAIAPVEAGQTLLLPLAFALGSDVLRGQVQKAMAIAADSHTVHCAVPADVVRDAGEGRGRGVFAGRAYLQNELVGKWPCRAIPDGDVPSGFLEYVFTAPKLGESLVLYGHGALYNDGMERANIGWSVPTDAELMLTGEGCVQFFAKRDIARGEELLSSYGSEYWRVLGASPI